MYISINMDYITTTDLRTRSSKLVATLKKGGVVSLIHRSRMIGVIKPVIEKKLFDATKFILFSKEITLPKTTYSQREKIYRQAITDKYGKDIS